MRTALTFFSLLMLLTSAYTQPSPDCKALSKAMWAAQQTLEQLPNVAEAQQAAIKTAEAFGNACLTERAWSLTIVPGKQKPAFAKE